MHLKPHKTLIPLAAALAAVAGVATAHAQSADALIDKLVDKGVLTVKEANQLREESDKNFTTAYQTKSGMPDWVSSFRLNGDFRGRYDGIFNPEPAPGAAQIDDRHRFRYRLRFGAVATIRDNFEVGFRLTSSDAAGTMGGDPISGNSTFQDNGSKKFIYIDQAYAKWTAINSPDMLAVATIGKMENPFVFSEMVFDGDYTPEGAAINFNYNLTDTQILKFNGAGFMLDESSADGNDPYLLGAQLRWDATWTPKIQSSVGAALLSIVNAKPGLPTAAVPDQNHGNVRTPAGGLTSTFSTFVADASVTYNLDSFPFYTGLFPIRVGAEYLENLAADSRPHAYGFGFTLGKSGKKGLWDVSYKWKELQANAWYEELVDSDFGGFYRVAAPFASGTGYRAGTNLRGHMIRAQYSFYDSFTLGSTAYIAEVVDRVGATRTLDSDVIRLQVDAVWKF